jgi:hypothetical protein
MQVAVQLLLFTIAQGASAGLRRQFVDAFLVRARELHSEQMRATSGVMVLSSDSITRARMAASVFDVKICELICLGSSSL